jgi:hypothetical protein
MLGQSQPQIKIGRLRCLFGGTKQQVATSQNPKSICFAF